MIKCLCETRDVHLWNGGVYVPTEYITTRRTVYIFPFVFEMSPRPL